jgi:ABC-2 type transport system permease protein
VRFAVERLTARLLRRGAGLLALAAAAYMSIEVLGYRSAYPDDASREQITKLADSAAVRALQGVPEALESPGGYAVWDGGWLLALIVGTWALVVSTRLLRGEEDSGRAEQLLARGVGARRLLVGQVAVLALGLLAVALVTAGTLVALGEPVGGSVLFGLGLACFGAVMAAAGALAAQVVEPRRRALMTGAAFLLLTFVVRTFANSTPARAWLLPTTPFGWLDGLDPYADDHWLGLLPSVACAAGLAALAVFVRGRRDAGAALVRVSESRPPRFHLLGSATAFGWRITNGMLAAWAVGFAVLSVLLGTMTKAVADLLDDETYRKTFEQLGVDLSAPVDAFLSLIAVALALGFCLFACWRVGAVRQEEAEGRLDHLLVRPVVRGRWLTATFLLDLLAAVGIVILSGLALWLGTIATRADVGWWQAVGPFAATLPAVVLFAGLTVLVFGALPRLTVVLPATVAVVSYLLNSFVPLLGLPSWVQRLSPFDAVARLPGEGFAWASSMALVGAGLAAAALGVGLFARRDLFGS